MATHTVVISFNAKKRTVAEPIAQICSTFTPNNAAADLEVFEGTYYDTNVEGWGKGTSLGEFMAAQVAYPKLNAYLRKAIRDSRYEFSTDDEAFRLYLEECAPVLAREGFKIEIT